MRNARLATMVTAVVSVASAFQVSQPAKSPYERRGLYHATIHGRIVSPSGEPVAQVHVQLNAGPPRALPLVDVVTDTDGHFTMREVNSIYPPYLTWFPPEQWLDGGTPIAGENAADLDVGVIELKPATIIRVAVEMVGGPTLSPASREPLVALQAKAQFGPLVNAERIGSELVLRGVSFDEGSWDVRVFSKSKFEEYTAPFHGQTGRRDQKFTLRLLRNTLAAPVEFIQRGRMEVSESIVPAASFGRERTVAGKVVGPDRTPIEGAIVSDFGLPIRRSMMQWVRTGRDGDFILKSRSTGCAMPSVSYGDSEYWNLYFSKPSMRDIPCDDWLRAPHTIVMPSPTRLSIHVSALEPSKARADWWHDSFGWQRFSSLSPWISTDVWDCRIRVSADGYLPRIQELKFSYSERSRAEPPVERPMDFHLDATVRRTLSVRGGGRPLAGVYRRSGLRSPPFAGFVSLAR